MKLCEKRSFILFFTNHGFVITEVRIISYRASLSHWRTSSSTKTPMKASTSIMIRVTQHQPHFWKLMLGLFELHAEVRLSCTIFRALGKPNGPIRVPFLFWDGVLVHVEATSMTDSAFLVSTTVFGPSRINLKSTWKWGSVCLDSKNSKTRIESSEKVTLHWDTFFLWRSLFTCQFLY